SGCDQGPWTAAARRGFCFTPCRPRMPLTSLPLFALPTVQEKRGHVPAVQSGGGPWTAAARRGFCFTPCRPRTGPPYFLNNQRRTVRIALSSKQVTIGK